MNAVLTPFRLPFDPKRNVVDFGVQAELLKSKPVQRDPHLDFQSKQGVEIKAQAQGESRGIPNLPQGAAGAEISFSRENAAFVAALGVKEYQVSDQYGLQEELKELVRAAKFPPDYVVVTDIISARSATILISTGRGQSITIQADASADAAPFNARLGGKLSVFTTKFAGMNFSGAR